MNSLNNTNCHDHHDNDHCKAILKCGNPGSVTIPNNTPSGTDYALSSVTIDTSRFHKPCIKLEFASNLILDSFGGTIAFQVFKLCKGQFQPIAVGPQWTFFRSSATISDTFAFIVCDCDCSSCYNECCTYTVVATVVGPPTEDTISINNATLAAIVIESDKKCC